MALKIDLSEYIKGVRIESAFLPEIYLPDPFKAGPPSPFLQMLKPKITVESTLGNQVLTPYGDPGASIWPAIKTGVLLLAIGFMIRKLVK